MASVKIVEGLRKRAIKDFLDILVLTEIKDNPLSGCDVISLVQGRFGILLSSGTVYSLLYSLEREGLIKGVWDKQKRVYELTEKGEQNIKAITEANEEIQNFLRNISSLKS